MTARDEFPPLYVIEGSASAIAQHAAMCDEIERLRSELTAHKRPGQGNRMRAKRKELADAVMVAARAAAKAHDTLRAFMSSDCPQDVLLAAMADRHDASGNLSLAIEEYDAYDAAVITGAGARWAEGSETSRQAAFMAFPRQGSVRHQIVAMMVNVPPLAHPGYTDRQLEKRLSASHQTVSSARNWLVEAGWLEDSGVRRETNKRPATVWQLTPAGRRQLTERNP